MVHFESIRWKNFLSTGNNWNEIQLDEHPNTLVVGENGAGKSTFLDAMTFALFGKPFRKINKPLLCNSINGGDCLTEVKFTSGTKEYLIRRGIKPAKFDIIVDGKPMDQSASIRDFQDILETQILGFNYKAFTQVVILGSSTFVPFMQLPAAHRREIIEELLDIKIFSSMNDILKENVSALKDRRTENATNIAMKEQFIEVQTENLARIAADNQNLVNRQSTGLDELVLDNQEIEDYIAKTVDAINAAQEKLPSYQDQQSRATSLEKIKNKLENKEQTLTHEIDFYGNHDECPTCHQGIDDEFKNDTLESRQEKLDEVVGGLVALGIKIDENNALGESIRNDAAIIENLQDQVKSSNTKLLANESMIANMKSTINDLTVKAPDSSAAIEAGIALAKTDLVELVAEADTISNLNEMYKIATGLLKDGGIKTLIIKQYLPIINTLVNQHLADLDFFVNFQLDENFDETLKSRGRDDFSYSSFSEGEKMRIDLALLFTWRSIAKMKNTTNTNLLILDEVFDSSLDETGTSEFLKVLYALGGENIFVISHKKDVLMDKFANTLNFEKVKDFSRVSQ